MGYTQIFYWYSQHTRGHGSVRFLSLDFSQKNKTEAAARGFVIYYWTVILSKNICQIFPLSKNWTQIMYLRWCGACRFGNCIRNIRNPNVATVWLVCTFVLPTSDWCGRNISNCPRKLPARSSYLDLENGAETFNIEFRVPREITTHYSHTVITIYCTRDDATTRNLALLTRPYISRTSKMFSAKWRAAIKYKLYYIIILGIAE